jgi:predicted transcriptional regulator
MNSSQLAIKMLEWEEKKRALDALSAEIESEVLKLEKTQVVGKVRVTYSGGRATYDYQTPAREASIELIEKYSTERTVTDWDLVKEEVPEVIAKYSTIEIDVAWNQVCKEAGIEPVVLLKTEPIAKIKLED